MRLRRSMTMPFAPGMHVFPGGGVSASDESTDDPLRACAIRETYEEVEIRVDECSLFDRWITPENEDRRYDVSFYLAEVQDLGRLVTTEADEMVWIAPVEALERHARGEFPMLHPTRVVLEDIAAERVIPGVPPSDPVAKLPRRRLDGSWDVIDARTGITLAIVDDGPTFRESDGRPSRT